MYRVLFSCFIILVIFGCSASDYTQVARVATSYNVKSAAKNYAIRKSVRYAANPKKLQSDIKSFKNNFLAQIAKFIKVASGEWGKENVKKPTKKKYVKYTQNYKSRTEIDFDRGLVTVETVDQKKPIESLKKAIVTTLLTPEDPRGVDLYSSKPVKIGGKPYLHQEVLDHQNKAILYEWRAGQYAKYLTKNSLKKKLIKKGGKDISVHYVSFNMVKDHEKVRLKKFKPFIERYAKNWRMSKNLVYAIIKTESNFNQYAVSSAGAIGLMQIVPSTAGIDAYKHAKNKTAIPSKEYLFNAKNNIELGCAYLNLINFKYLGNIQNSISREYCVISAYNTGSGNVLRTFSKNRQNAVNIINSKKPSQVYATLKTKLPYHETRRYLIKVLNHKKEFVKL